MIRGRFTARGYFKVREEDRLGMPRKFVDEAGYLLTADGIRVVNERIGRRIRMRRDERNAEYMRP